ncbi:serine hydrolase [Micromonospora sp. KC721]|uniref:serine hydrolase domain-containing protein n=1 Tax=Micromonospora sp. KC721 TaxID=2530380 RepID=UPI00104FA587|nr:serine hydrolase domain-containing protein [Micromonospora sp. KC721]TDB82185.1 class A beta-lactamase-related serine hydrolase [Micromonospora sp. KC721]
MHLSRRGLLKAGAGGALAVAVPLAGTPHRAEAAGRLPEEALAAGLSAVTDAGMVGVFAEARDGGCRWRGASGLADVDTGRPMRHFFQHRVGSITKTFVATTLLQLVGEGRLALDAPIGRHLPQYAVDGVTVEMLLNHTSGIGDYDTVLFTSGEDVERHRYTTFTPDQLVRLGLAAPRTGTPGERFDYSNTNYILAGLLIERLTGRPATEEIDRRVIRPLRLTDTYFPGRRTRITGPHSAAYLPWYDGNLRDFNVTNMSWAWTAGALISTSADLNRFFRALLGGRLLRRAELARMRSTVPLVPEQPEAGGYGLGLYWLGLPGGPYWGHDGLVFGHSTISLHSPDGTRQVTLGSNVTHYAAPGAPDPIADATFAFLITALGGSSARTPGPVRARTVSPLPGGPALVHPLPPAAGRQTG